MFRDYDTGKKNALTLTHVANCTITCTNPVEVEDINEDNTSTQNSNNGEDTNETANDCSIHDDDIP
eukprot:10116448-Ditylum_brightwellii.AAC.1